jgi:phytoene dehydrogenase-like protein
VTAAGATDRAPYDAVVIGAGLNGLVAAAYLAKAGQRVLVLERRNIAGGTAVTEEVFPGFRFDTCRHDTGWIPPRIISDLKLKRHGLELVDVDASVFAPLPGGGRNDYLLLHHDPQRSAALIRKHSQGDAQKWPAFATRIARLSGFVKAVYASPAPAIDSTSFDDLLSLARLGTRLRMRLGKTEMVELLRTLPMSVGELLDDWFETDALKGVVGARGVTGIMQGPRSGGTAFVLLHHQVGRPAGAFRAPYAIRGGVGGLARALATAATSLGAEIRTGVEVVRVNTKGGGATGVVLRNGDEIGARRVVSSTDSRRTFLDLCDPARLDPDFVRAVRNVRYRGAWAKVNLALEALPTFSALREGGETTLRGTISISPSLDYLERAYDDAKYGRVSEHPHLEIRIPSLADASLAPPGRHVMSIEVQYAPYQLQDGEWDDRARDALGDRVVETLATYAPDLPGAVLHRQVLTPRDLENVFALTEGHAYQGELTLDQILFMRPVAGWGRYRTPVRDLYLCGAATHPGGGIAGAAGANAAREILKQQEHDDWKF